MTELNGSTSASDGATDGSTVFDRIRAASSAVAERAVHVDIDLGALHRLATTLAPEEPPLLPEEHATGDADAMAAEVVVWNAVNFGSGWFPELTKREGLSGARTLAEALADHVAASGVPGPAVLAEADAVFCAEVFGQPHPGPVDDLLELFAQAWRELGALLTDHFDGSAAELVRSAGGSAAALVSTIGALPLAQDVAQYGEGHDEIEVPFYKRAQITVSHLARVFDGQGLGWFDDVDQLTAFADNLVPHVLRMSGVLVYDEKLAAHIEDDYLLDPGGAPEVEIRACGLHAVELLSSASGLPAATIDHQLWQRGQDPDIKAVPRHRCRGSWY